MHGRAGIIMGRRRRRNHHTLHRNVECRSRLRTLSHWKCRHAGSIRWSMRTTRIKTRIFPQRPVGRTHSRAAKHPKGGRQWAVSPHLQRLCPIVSAIQIFVKCSMSADGTADDDVLMNLARNLIVYISTQSDWSVLQQCTIYAFSDVRHHHVLRLCTFFPERSD